MNNKTDNLQSSVSGSLKILPGFSFGFMIILLGVFTFWPNTGFSKDTDTAQQIEISEEETALEAKDDSDKDVTDIEINNVEQNLRRVLTQAYKTNPTLRAARASMRATHEKVPQASAGWKPTITASGDVVAATNEGSNFGGAGGSTSESVELAFNQPVFRGGQTLAAFKQAREEIATERALLEATTQNILLQAVIAYMDVLRDEAVWELSVQNEAVIKQQREATNERFEVGELTKTDVAQAEARFARAVSDRIEAAGGLENSRAIYEEVIGEEPGVLIYSDINLEIPDNLEDAVTVSYEENPELDAARYLHKQSEYDVKKNYGELLPTLDFFGTWNRTYDPQPGLIKESTAKSVGLSASIPLYQAGAVRSRIREAKYNANKRFIEIKEAERGVKRSVVKFWEDWKTAKAQIESRRSQVEASMIANEGVHAEADLGLRTVLDALDADQELLDARVALVRAKRDEVVARFSLAASIGLMSLEALGIMNGKFDFATHLEKTNDQFLGTNVYIDE